MGACDPTHRDQTSCPSAENRDDSHRAAQASEIRLAALAGSLSKRASADPGTAGLRVAGPFAADRFAAGPSRFSQREARDAERGDLKTSWRWFAQRISDASVNDNLCDGKQCLPRSIDRQYLEIRIQCRNSIPT